MKRSKAGVAALALAASLAGVSGVAMARGHVGVGVYFGGPVVSYPYPYPYPYPYYPVAPYYPPAVVEVPSQPVTYIQRDDMSGEADNPGADWYYCAKSGAYYPNVKTCPSGWQRVPPQSAH